MNTIEERVKEYTEQARNTLDYEFNEDHVTFENIVESAFIAGAISERNEFLRWHDPKKELPDYYHTVLIKYLKDSLYAYAAAWLSVNDNGEYLWTIAETDILIADRSVHGWRHIHEL